MPLRPMAYASTMKTRWLLWQAVVLSVATVAAASDGVWDITDTGSLTATSASR